MDKILYRVQDDVGRGPWRPGCSKRWIENRSDTINLIPWYVEFGPIHLQRKPHEFIGCGCETIQKLKRWITLKEYRILLKLGYHAVEISPARILASSNIQTVFTRKKALWKDIKIFNLY